MRSQNRRQQLRYSQQQRPPRLRQHRWQRRPWPLRQRLPLAPDRGLDRVLRLSRLQRPCLHRLQCLDLGPVRERLLLAILFPCLNPVYLPDRHQPITQRSLLKRKF